MFYKIIGDLYEKIGLILALSLIPIVGVEASEATTVPTTVAADENVTYYRTQVYKVVGFTGKEAVVHFQYDMENKTLTSNKVDIYVPYEAFQGGEAILGHEYLISHSGAYEAGNNVFRFTGIEDINEVVEKTEVKLLDFKDWTFELDNKTYSYTGYESGIKRKKDPDDKISGKGNGFSDIIYQKGLSENTVDLKINGKWYIFANSDFPKNEIPEQVFNATYMPQPYDDGTITYRMDKIDEDLFGPISRENYILLNKPTYELPKD